MCRLLLSSLGEDGVGGWVPHMEYQKSSPTHQPHPLPAANSSVDVQKFSAADELSSKAKGS